MRKPGEDIATALLAIGDIALREACCKQLEAAGHAPVLLRRSLEVLTLAAKLRWDFVCLDDTTMGREVLALHAATVSSAPMLGLGVAAPPVIASVPLPLLETGLLATVRELLAGPDLPITGIGLRLDPARRLASANRQSVQLTRIEYRLLEFLVSQGARDVALPELLQAVWGTTEGRGTADLVRSHVRNLRRKLARIGLADAVRSRRERGYSFVE